MGGAAHRFDMQAFLDNAKVDGLDLRGAMFGEQADFRGLPSAVQSVCCSPDGLYLFAGLYDGTIAQLDRQTKKASGSVCVCVCVCVCVFAPVSVCVRPVHVCV